MTQQPNVPMLEMRRITKSFPGVVANDAIDFDVRRGEIHSLLGENGAGKSTLMKILYGLYRPDDGIIAMDGQQLDLHRPADAIASGIGMIHQHFMLVPTLTVAENVSLGLPSSRRPFTDLAEVRRRISELAERYKLQVDPDAHLWQLAVGERQRVEIIKALYRNARLLVLDEPTAVLTPQEVTDLFVTLRHMASAGRALIFISHKLHEVMTISDRITVMRNGKVVGTTVPAASTRQDLALMMVGRAVRLAPDRPEVEVGKERLVVTDLIVPGDRGGDAVEGLSLAVRSGEVLGIAGVSGNGQRELAEAIAGLRPVTSGTIAIDGVDVTDLGPRQMRAAGLAYVPEERMRDGAIADFTVAENMVLIDHSEAPYDKRGFLQFDAIERHCSDLVDAYAVKTPSLSTPTRNLSGGNIQKLILARELASSPDVLIAAQPTRGIDIGAAEYIHSRIAFERGRGTAIVVISEDLDEVYALSDRILVMYEGRSMGIVDPGSVDRNTVGLLMAGVAG